VDLACVDLIEQRHHDERVEDDGEVLVGSRTQRLTTTVHVKQPLTCHRTHRSSQLNSPHFVSTQWQKPCCKATQFAMAATVLYDGLLLIALGDDGTRAVRRLLIALDVQLWA